MGVLPTKAGDNYLRRAIRFAIAVRVGIEQDVGRVPVGWTEVGYAGRSWGLTRTDHARGGTTTLYAEELGGQSAVSANVWHTSGGDVLRPCEMPAQVVLDFLRGWEPGA